MSNASIWLSRFCLVLLSFSRVHDVEEASCWFGIFEAASRLDIIDITVPIVLVSSANYRIITTCAC
jgi:hypothetical protein